MANPRFFALIASLLLALSGPTKAAGLFGFGGAQVSSDYAATEHPIMLVHGMLGWNTFKWGMEYWHQVPAALQEAGATVYVVQVRGFESSEERGEDLLRQMEEIAAADGVEKFHLIGHSHGGATSRYAAHMRPDLVASVTGIGAPGFGSEVADLVLGLTLDGTPLEPVVGTVAYTALNAVATLLNGLQETPVEGDQDARASMVSLSTAGAAEFNARYPWGMPSEPCGEDADRFVDWKRGGQKGRIHYYAWTGIQPVTNPLDPSDLALGAASLAFMGKPNDGLVWNCSAYMGEMLGDSYAMNHLDETNLFFGLTNILEQDPVELIRVHANRLKLLEESQARGNGRR